MNPKSLIGKTVLITRARVQALELQSPLEALGARALLQPAIEILPPTDPAALDDALRKLAGGNFDWILFSSANGARRALERLVELFSLAPDECGSFLRARGVRAGAVGSGTAKALAPYRVAPDVVPERFDAEGFVSALDAVVADYPSRRFLLPRANRGRRVLADALRERGATFQEVEAYRSVDVATPDPRVAAALREGQIDAATVASSASAKALAAMFGSAASKTRWIAISPLTARALREVGIPTARVAREATIPSLVEAVADAIAEE